MLDGLDQDLPDCCRFLLIQLQEVGHKSYIAENHEMSRCLYVWNRVLAEEVCQCVHIINVLCIKFT